MSLTIASTTSPQSHLDAAVSDSWRTPPPPADKPKDPASTTNGEIPIDKLPPKEFNAAREEQVRESKDAARAALEGDDGEKRYRNKGSGGLRRRIDTVTKNWRTEESRRIAVEKELAGLKAGSNSLAPPSPTPPAQASDVNPPRLEQRPATQPAKVKTEESNPQFEAARQRHEDFDHVMREADQKGIGADMSAELRSAIEKTPNRAEVVYLLAKSPELIQRLKKDFERDPSIVAKLSSDVELIHRQASDPTFRRVFMQRDEHQKRTAQLLMALPDAAKLSTIPVPVHSDVERAIYEQSNSPDIDIYLRRNPAEVSKLQRMTVHAAIAEIGRIAAQLESNAKRERVRAPEPISPVGASASRSGTSSYEQMSIKEYIKTRNKEERARRW
jgi:hypothetical protein